MRLALLLGVEDAGQSVEEPVGRPHVQQLDAEVATERLDDLLALASTHEAGVDEDARELVADRLVDEGGGDGGVDATGQAADRPCRGPPAPAPPSTWVSMIDVIVHVGRHAARVVEEPLAGAPGPAACARPRGGTARRTAPRSVDSKAAAGRRRRRRGDGEARRRVGDRVEVAHPDGLLRGRSRPNEQPAVRPRPGDRCGRTRRVPSSPPHRRGRGRAAARRSRCRAAGRRCRRCRCRSTARLRCAPTPARPRR